MGYHNAFVFSEKQTKIQHFFLHNSFSWQLKKKKKFTMGGVSLGGVERNTLQSHIFVS